jgi:hypothetical protein
MSIMLHNGLFRNSTFSAALLVLFTTIGAQENIKLRMIPMVEAPVIEKKILKLNVDFVFNHCPQEYWIHYNRETGRIVIEFFGFHIDAPPLTIKGTSVVSDLTFFNSETNMALSGKSAQISMALQEGWHYESWIISGKVLRLQLWMPLNPGKILMSRKNRFILPMVLTIFGVAAVTYFIIAAINNSTD